VNERIAVYTAIFGNYDGLIPQPKIPGVEYHCFTDAPKRARGWNVHIIDPPTNDSTRSARRVKILPHDYLPDFEQSIWIDGNYRIVGDLRKVMRDQLSKNNMAVYDHNTTLDDRRNCVYDEYEAIMHMGKARGSYKDDPSIMEQQITRYRQEGYPAGNGLIFSAVLLRNHLAEDVIRTMKTWWHELETGSRRDQLSFNYSAWKEKFSFSTIHTDLRNNEYFFMIGKHRTSYRGKLLRYWLKRSLGIIRHK
jgi:hypothetical protein